MSGQPGAGKGGDVNDPVVAFARTVLLGRGFPTLKTTEATLFTVPVTIQPASHDNVLLHVVPLLLGHIVIDSCRLIADARA